MINLNTIEKIDCRSGLKALPDESVDCCLTSPPYWGLRDYGTAKWEGGDKNCEHNSKSKNVIEKSRSTSTISYAENNGNSLTAHYKDVCKKCGAVRFDNQLGLEKSPEEYTMAMVEVFAEVKRVLKKQGTLWLNLGDTYYGGKGMNGASKAWLDNADVINKKAFISTAPGEMRPNDRPHPFLKAKDLVGIPWMVAFALRSAGWYLRQDIIWNKPNSMPESVTDRCTKSHEYIFLLSKSSKYYYDIDAIRTPVKDSTVQRMMQQLEDQKGSDRVPGKTNGNMKAVGPGRKPAPHDSRGGNQGGEIGIKAYSHRGSGDKKLTGHSGNFDSDGSLIGDGMANKKSVWTVTTKPFSEAHFATFPEDLIVDCIKAGCPEGGIVLDPFMGAGTTALVAQKLQRNFIGFELNPEYIKIANKRLKKELGLFHPDQKTA